MYFKVMNEMNGDQLAWREPFVSRSGKRELTDGAVADRITVRRVIKAPPSSAIDRIVNVVTQTVATLEDAISSAQYKKEP